MITTFVPKRPHRKSRAGCQTCKTRKIKCNEAHPKCSFCDKRSLKCIYVDRVTALKVEDKSTPQPLTAPPSGNSSPISDYSQADIQTLPRSPPLVHLPTLAISSSNGNLSRLDMQLMHHWSTSTWETISVGTHADHVMQQVAPQLGFENDFLLDCILGISSLHREFLYPDSAKIRQQTVLYRVRALNSFRERLPTIDANSASWEAALLMSILLVVLCSRDYNIPDGDIAVINWLSLYRGLVSIISMKPAESAFSFVQASKVSPLFKRELVPLRLAPVVPACLLKMVQDIGPLDADFDHLESYCTALDTLGVLYGSLRQDGTTPALYVRVISWPSWLSQQFAISAREKRSRTLIILGYYLVFVKLCSEVWYIRGTPDFQIKAIAAMLDPEWLHLLKVPLEATRTNDNEELTRLLLR